MNKAILYTLTALLIVLGLMLPSAGIHATTTDPVSVQLVMILDGSNSIDQQEWNTQIDGLRDSILDPGCMPRDGSVQLTVIQIGGEVVWEWWIPSYYPGAEVHIKRATVDSCAGDLAEYVDDVIRYEKIGGATPLHYGIGMAIEHVAGDHIVGGAIQVINISTDGGEDQWSSLKRWVAETARDSALDAGFDQVLVEGIGDVESGRDVPWLRDRIAYPQPGHLAPPWTPGWVYLGADCGNGIGTPAEFKTAVCQKIACCPPTPTPTPEPTPTPTPEPTPTSTPEPTPTPTPEPTPTPTPEPTPTPTPEPTPTPTIEPTPTPTPGPDEPTICHSPSSLSFGAAVGVDPSDQVLEIWNCDGPSTVLDWSVTADVAWISLSPPSGSSTGEVDEVTVSIDSSSMAAGSYEGHITISAPGAGNSPRTVTVNLTITSEGAIICYSPPTVSFSALEGSNPATQTLAVWNCNGPDTTLSWSVSDNVGWLSLSPTSGTSSGEEDTVTLTATSWSLLPGIREGAITISASGAGNSPQVVPVTLEIIEQTFDDPPLAPSDLVATGDTNEVDLTWVDNSDNEIGFIIERKNRPKGYFHEIGRVAMNMTSYLDSGVECGRTYYYRVRAWNYIHRPHGRIWAGSDYSNEATAECGYSGDGRCFIATAACESDTNPAVNTLRDFRDDYMTGSGVGLDVVSSYYRISPPIAEFIDSYPSLKPVVRAGLLPAVGTSAIATSGTACRAGVVGIAATMLAIASIWACRRRVPGNSA